MSRVLSEVLGTFVNAEHKKGVVISYDRPGECIRSVLRKCWIPIEDLILLDGATRIGGLPTEHDGKDPMAPRIRVLEDPFDLGCLMEALRKALLEDFKDKASMPEEVRGKDPRVLEEELLKAELDIYGIEGSGWSLLKHRIKQRIKESVRMMDLEAPVPGKHQDKGIPAGTAVSVDEWLASQREGADFVIIENLAVLSAYLSEEALDEMLRGLRSLIAEDLCRSVLIFLDRMQYQSVVEGLTEAPDIGYELETETDMGITGYRFIPIDHGPG
jgi:hypothetical protein